MKQLTRRNFTYTLAASAAAARLGAIPPRPKLFVLLIAEQFRPDYLARFSPLFVPGGFRRLLDEAAYLPDCRMNASSFSASGIATIATGAYPQTHGIVAESWFDPERKKIESASQAACQSGTLADEVMLADVHNRVLAVGDERAHTSLAVSSSTYPHLQHRVLALDSQEAHEPDWLPAFRRAHAPERFKDTKWLGLLAVPGAPALRTLAGDAARPEEFTALYNSSPFALEAQFDFLRSAIAEENLGQGSAFDFITVVLSPMAKLGYEVGGDSPLMRELVLHCDRQIEATFEMLKKQVGAGNFGLGFAAAHGAPDYGAKAINGDAVVAAAERALSAAYDLPSSRNRWIERYVYPFLYLNHGQLERFGVDAREARRAAGDAVLRGVPGAAAYYTADGACSVAGQWKRRFENSFHPLRSGDLMLAYGAGVVEDYGQGRGLSYGSLYNYDIQTPLFLFGPQFRACTLETPVEAVDIAPTLARALGAGAPSSSTGRVLGEILIDDSRAKQEKQEKKEVK